MALLALLGAGNSPTQGKYRAEVVRGLEYLIVHQAADGGFYEPGGRLYSHGLATLALCEAIAMMRDEFELASRIAAEHDSADEQLADERVTAYQWGDRYGDDTRQGVYDEQRGTYVYDSTGRATSPLRRAAQRAVTYTEKAQHNRGGWRYEPRQSGDTSVVGWQVMALRSADLAGLDLDPKVLERVGHFLNSASDDQIGSCYGYQRGTRRQQVPLTYSISATTPIGLLCRMYTGWDRDKPGLRLGAQRIGLRARSGMGMYFYYYATQVMHHFGGPLWEEWNQWMRRYLVGTQERKGSAAGSWFFRGSHDDAGRLYCTAMAAMTLEVYYRYSPIYGAEAVGASRP